MWKTHKVLSRRRERRSICRRGEGEGTNGRRIMVKRPELDSTVGEIVSIANGTRTKKLRVV